MHTPGQFTRLSLPEQFALLEDEGIYLEVYRLQGGIKIALFYLYGYYVEVFYDMAKDKVISTAPFVSYRKLDPYLTQIDLTSIYSCL